MMDQQKITEIFSKFYANNPEPKIELKYTNHYTLLVAVVLSAQSTDVRVNIITKELFQITSKPSCMLALGEEELKQHIKSIGLYNAKAHNIILLSKKLVDDGHDSGEIPCDFNYLMSLPGVGRKSANVILNSCFGKPTVGVDTHVFRVSNRIGLTQAKNVTQTEQQLMKIVPPKYLRNSHHWLVLHGRYVCRARKALCKKCIIKDLCEYKEKQL